MNYHRSFVEMGLQDETRARIWLAAISPLPTQPRASWGPRLGLVRLILSKCGGKVKGERLF